MPIDIKLVINKSQIKPISLDNPPNCKPLNSNTPNWDALKSQGRVALRKIAVATPLNSKAPVLSHKSYCSKCNRDSFITWITYPNERNKKLGCSICSSRINFNESYKVDRN